MRRKDREMSAAETLSFIGRCKVCRLAMYAKGELYIVPLNFGCRVEDGALTLFFHSAKAGKKLELLAETDEACFEMDGCHQLVEAEAPCRHSYLYTSAIGRGKFFFLTDTAEKIRALQAIMRQQTGKDFAFKEAEAETVCVFKVEVTEFSGKRH